MKNLKGILISNDERLCNNLKSLGVTIVNIEKPFHMTAALKEGQNADFVVYDHFVDAGKSISYMVLSISEKINIKEKPLIILSNEKDIDVSALTKMGVDDVFERDVDVDVLHQRILFLSEYSKEIKTGFSDKEKSSRLCIPMSKRVFDIVIASLALLLLSPILVLVMLLIKLESKGPIFYSSKRVGMGYKIFDFYKFRSMYKDADQRLKNLKNKNEYALQSTNGSASIKYLEYEKDQNLINSKMLFSDEGFIDETAYLDYVNKEQETAFIKIKDDPRITKIGRFIRNTSIDELPQLINVLKGDMSIVGNRPLPLYEAECLTSDEWIERFSAPAGLTGLWQVEERAKAREMSPEERKKLDIQYARSYSLNKDIVLMIRTVPALFQSENV